MKRTLTLISLLVFGLAVVITGCKKDDDTLSIVGDGPQNQIVEKIQSSVPRVVINNNTMTAFLSVTDGKGNPLSGITVNSLEIEYDAFGSTVQVPRSQYTLYSGGSGSAYDVCAALTMDYSGSMFYDTTHVPAMEMAVKNFISLKNNNDFMEILKFSADVHRVVPFTNSVAALHFGIDSIDIPHSSTAFYRSCEWGLDDADSMVVNTHLSGLVLPSVIGFTDGVNNQAPLQYDSLINKALTMQIPIYTIGFGNLASGYPDTVSMHHIADTTGGRFYFAPNTYAIQELYQYVSGQLSSMYVVTFPFGTGSKINDTGVLRIKVSYTMPSGTATHTSTKTFYLP